MDRKNYTKASDKHQKGEGRIKEGWKEGKEKGEEDGGKEKRRQGGRWGTESTTLGITYVVMNNSDKSSILTETEKEMKK